jgi:hypothetical protein
MLSRFLSGVTPILAVSLLATQPSLIAQGQQAILADGTTLIIKAPLELWGVEGAIYNIEVEKRLIDAAGIQVTIPATIDGADVLVGGTEALAADGTSLGEISAATFDRFLDNRAIGSDRDAAAVEAGLGPRRLGATRSLFSTIEARRAVDGTSVLVRDNVAQSAIEQNYFNMVQAVYPQHAAFLPADFLDRAGLRGTDPANWVYPTSTGGTLKSAGHVYINPLTLEEYRIPDLELVVELAENVRGGIVSSAVAGSGAIPGSFVIDNTLVIFNQDPRFPAHTFGFGLSDLSRTAFFAALSDPNTDHSVTAIGHMVSEHVMFAQEIETELVDLTAPIQITADRFMLRVAQGEIRFRGTVDQPTGIVAAVVLIDGLGGPDLRFALPLAIDPLTGTATYTFRQRRLDLDNVFEIAVEARDEVTGALVAREVFDVTAFRQ